MKLRSIRLENVRRFVDPVEIGGIGDGVNVLSAPNEHGKSTVLDALHAVFFKPRRAWDKEIRSLVPHAGGDPSVSVEIEVAEGVYRIEKRWSQRRNGDVRIKAGGRLVRQADEAEAWISDILKAPRDGGPAALLWVRQGQASLDDGDAAHSTRRDLLTSVAGEVEAITGGRRMDAAHDRCRRDLGRYLTPTGRAKADGPLRQWQVEVERLDATRQDLAAKSGRLRRELDRRRSLRRELADLEDPVEQEERKARLAEAEAAHSIAARHAEMLKQALSAEHTKRVEAERADEQLALLDRDLAERDKAAEALLDAKEQARRAMSELRGSEAKRSETLDVRDIANARAELAADTVKTVLLAARAAAETERRKELIRKIERTQELRLLAEEAAARARKELADSVLEELERLDESARVVRRARELEAPAITVTYSSGRTDGVSISGKPLPGGKRLPLPDGARLDIDGIGQLDVQPGQRPDDETLARAEEELAQALRAAGAKSVDDVRASVNRRRKAELSLRNAEADLQNVAPDGVDALRDQLAAIPERADGENDLPTIEEAQKEHEAARHARAKGSEEYEVACSELAQAKAASGRAEAAGESARTRLARAEATLSGIDDPKAERARRDGALSRARAGLEDAKRRRMRLEEAAPDLEIAAAALERARSVVERARNDRERIRLELAGLDSFIDGQAGEAVDEELADIDTRLTNARTRLADLEYEVAVLKRLGEALEIARASARDRYVEPVMQELVPLLRLFWPEAQLRFDPVTLLPSALMRAGAEENFDILSGGTQEQIALLVRLAFARMLANAGTPAPIILDDAIVYTDDDRIERMFDALTRQAHDLQIVVFSCRQKAFRDLGGHGLEILPVMHSRVVSQ